MSSGIRGCWNGAWHQVGVIEPVVATLERAVPLVHQQAHDLDRFLEPVDPLDGRREVDAEATVLLLEPARADAQDQPALAHVVDRDGLLEQQRRMPEGVAGHERTQADARRARRDGRQHRPRLVHRIGRRAVRVLDVVWQPGVVEAQVLGHLELVVQLLEGFAGRGDEQAESEPRTSRSCPNTSIRSTPRSVRRGAASQPPMLGPVLHALDAGPIAADRQSHAHELAMRRHGVSRRTTSPARR